MLVVTRTPMFRIAVGAVCWLFAGANCFADSLFDSCETCPLTSTFGGVARGHSDFTFEAIRTSFDTPGGLVGHPNAPDSFNDFFVPSMAAMDGASVGTVTPSVVGQRQDAEESYGFRANWNYTTSEYGRVQVSGFWLDDATQYFQRGLGTLTSGADPTTVSVTAAGSFSDGMGGGYTIPFDQYFRIDLTSSASSIGGDFAPYGYWWGLRCFSRLWEPATSKSMKCSGWPEPTAASSTLTKPAGHRIRIP